MKKREVQRVTIRNYLFKGDRITAKEAAINFDIWRLSAIILDIKQIDKIPIDSNLTPNYKNGRFSRYANYQISPTHLQEARERFGFKG